MPCYKPLKGFRGINGGISWSPPVSFVDMPMEVPCGQCIGCRLERSRQWAVRMMHEASLHEQNSFVTLTYDDEHLPKDGSLQKADFQRFMKRLRKKRAPVPVRYFHCGEYGDENGRPHYHAILFGVDFPDRGLDATSGRGDDWYSSPELQSLWPYGHATIGAVTFESCAYVARYVLKKVTGDRATDHYRRYSPDGEVYYLQPEYCSMSLKPGIGARWFEEYSKEVVDYDGVVNGGKLAGVPRYYDKLRDSEELRRTKRKRVRSALKHLDNNTPERLAVREEVKAAQVNLFLRRPV